MQDQDRELDFTGQDVSVGLDVGRKSWYVEIVVGDQFHRRFSQVPDSERLVKYLQRTFPGARYQVAYEAGYVGPWVYDEMTALGAKCLMINPADVPTRDKERRRKNDRVDANKIVRSLSRGELSGVYVPPVELREDRMLLRRRRQVVQAMARSKNRIKAQLAFYGYQVPEERWARCWSGAYVSWLHSLSFRRSSGKAALEALLQELEFHRRQLSQLLREIRTLSQQEPYRELVPLLCTVPGIGLVSAMTLVTELGTIERFTTLDHLASYVGLVPGEHSSGETQSQTGLTTRQNTVLRSLLIEAAWIAEHQDPVLMHDFLEYTKRMPKAKAIVHVARRLLNRIRYVWKNRQPYVPGVVSSN